MMRVITMEMIMNRHCGFDGCRIKEEEKSDDNFDHMLIFIIGIIHLLILFINIILIPIIQASLKIFSLGKQQVEEGRLEK